MMLRSPDKHQEAVKERRVVSTVPPLTPGSCSPLQLELLEARRAEVLNEKAFCIQCCWRRFKEKKTAKEKRSATLIQAGDLLRVGLKEQSKGHFQSQWGLQWHKGVNAISHLVCKSS